MIEEIIFGRFQEAFDKEDGDELSKSRFACSKDETARTGLDTGVMAMQGGLGEFFISLAFWGSHLYVA